MLLCYCEFEAAFDLWSVLIDFHFLYELIKYVVF